MLTVDRKDVGVNVEKTDLKYILKVDAFALSYVTSSPSTIRAGMPARSFIRDVTYLYSSLGQSKLLTT